MATAFRPPPPSAHRVYRFDAVEIDEGARSLRVDGRERACPKLAFNLLLALCESPRRVLARDELIGRLWPGNQQVADESLTQVIFRARSAIVPHDDRMVTVRGVGVRLEADVLVSEREAAPIAAPQVEPAAAADAARPSAADEEPAPRVPASDAPPAAVVARSTSRSRSRRPLLLLVALVVVALAYAATWRASLDEDWVERGHGIRAADLHAERPDTVELVRSAFRAEAQGDRHRAAGLLETVHGADLRTPVPALFLALFATANGDEVSARRWLDDARRRSEPLRDPYVDVLGDYIAAEIGEDWNAVMRSAGALLDMRPEAWRMRTARSHLLMFRGMREAALREMQQVEITALDDRKLEMALADRAALGDIPGAEAIFARLAPESNPPGVVFTRARIDYSRGDLAAARVGFARAFELGLEHNRLDIATRSQLMAGLLAMSLGDAADARVRLADAVARLNDRGALSDATDLGLVAAQLEALEGDHRRSVATLAQVRAVLRNAAPDRRAMTSLFELRLLGRDEDPIEAEPKYDTRGLPSLLAARRAHVAGDEARARSELEQATRDGIFATNYADEARLLAAELGADAPAAAPIDPPYPPWSRFASRWALDHLAPRND